jgi:hypothetical protein
MRYSTPQQVAAAILEVIPNYRRWLAGAEQARHGARHCVTGAVKRLGLEEEEVAEDFADKFWQVATEQYPDRYRREEERFPSWERKIIVVNDDEETRYDDIRLILEKIASG